MVLNVADLFEHAGDAVPERTALICGDRQLTYRELDEEANRLAKHLGANGIRAGDHVGVYARNRIETVVAMLATYKLRAVSVAVNYRYVVEELRYLFDNADLVALVHEREYSDKVAAARAAAPGLRHTVVIDDGSEIGYSGVDYEQAVAEQPDGRDFAPRSPDDVYIVYTGGTTGFPKGVMWRHEDVWRVFGGGIDFATGEYAADEWQQSRQAASGEGVVRLTISPLIHGAAQWAVLGALFRGNTVVLVSAFDPGLIWKLVQRHRIAAMAITGDAMGRPLLDTYRTGGYDASSLRILNSHAALFSQSVKQEFLAAFPDLLITDAIGSSESGFTGFGRVTADSDHSQGPRVNFSAQAILLDEDGNRLSPAPGVVGRVARTGHIPLGYYNDPVKSATIFHEIDGTPYVRADDYARYETDGTVTLLGRGSECINTGGEKVFPEEVETALKSHPDVYDVLVIGLPDERFGQRVGAIVQARPGAQVDIAALDAHTRDRIAGYKTPRGYWLVDEMQRLATGKANYAWAKRYADEHGDAVLTPR
ncbi:Long-chain-fatty-acid--CoA/3-oxocholest-4-en-26-oate--CoA ligase [Nocardia seriolae]|uniref:Long-chain-fatty-acid--CoA/3-oxocholest-4-en-26-oate--CoA ligase n=1 Tax=Nocardia seriolae TaxID=37332 RepID=A0ABC8AR08_9NOCA|nr:acyl-CoA synthetase [Nocardia seriolae]APA96744.1 Long-chain-fatty-acid--CoA/3-oxocholest-4-en-26-oate--CoA ligase [Nocardia seriolae]